MKMMALHCTTSASRFITPDLTKRCMTGTLPQSWGGNGSFAVLNSLEIDCSSNTSINDGITGSLPSEWGSLERFQFLQTLSINGCSITGQHCFLSSPGNVKPQPDCYCFATWVPSAQWCSVLGLHAYAASVLAPSM